MLKDECKNHTHTDTQTASNKNLSNDSNTNNSTVQSRIYKDKHRYTQLRKK